MFHEGGPEDGTPVLVYPRNVNEWFTRAVGTPCFLARGIPQPDAGTSGGWDMYPSAGGGGGLRGWPNDAPLLAVTSASVSELNRRIPADAPAVTPERFRPSLVLSGDLAPFEEDYWGGLAAEGLELRSVGGCAKCDVVGIDQTTGARVGPEPLLTLSTFRRIEGQLIFGLLLRAALVGDAAADLQGAAATPRAAVSGGATEDEGWMRSHWGALISVGQEISVSAKDPGPETTEQ